MVGIGEASDRTGVPVDTLRYWEGERVLVDVPRDGAGRRVYDEEALGWIRFVARMRSTGMPVRDVAAYAAAVREGTGTRAERRQILERHRAVVVAAIEELEAVRALLDEKVDDYATAEAGVTDDRADPTLESVRRLT